MVILTPDNAAEFLHRRGWAPPGPVKVTSLSGGVSATVLRVETSQGVFVLKQSCPQLRTKDAWFSDLSRIYREQEVMQVLEPHLPGVVPKVLFTDRESYVFAMSHAPEPSRQWKELLLSGETDGSLATQAGLILGRMHQVTAENPSLVDRFRDHTVFVQLRADPFYRRVEERRPEVAYEVAEIRERMLATKEALCHGDFTPKNLLVHDRGFTLVDYETAHLGDPTMDLGLFLTHLMLKAFRRPAEGQLFLDLTSAFWDGYVQGVTFQPWESLVARAIQHLGVCLLARIDGTSPVDYLPAEPKREAVRRLARELLLEKPPRWDDILSACRKELVVVEESR